MKETLRCSFFIEDEQRFVDGGNSSLFSRCRSQIPILGIFMPLHLWWWAILIIASKLCFSLVEMFGFVRWKKIPNGQMVLNWKISSKIWKMVRSIFKYWSNRQRSEEELSNFTERRFRPICRRDEDDLHLEHLSTVVLLTTSEKIFTNVGRWLDTFIFQQIDRDQIITDTVKSFDDEEDSSSFVLSSWRFDVNWTSIEEFLSNRNTTSKWFDIGTPTKAKRSTLNERRRFRSAVERKWPTNSLQMMQMCSQRFDLIISGWIFSICFASIDRAQITWT